MSDNTNRGTALTPAQEFNLQLDQQAANFKALLPSHISLEKFKRVVVVAVSQNPDLFRADRRSFFNAAQKCASDGLLPDGREAALVVYNTKTKVKLADGTQQEQWLPLCQYMPMVAGIRKRMRNSGEVTSAEAYVVYKNDKFFQQYGDDPRIVHEPPVLGVNRGEPVGAYAIIRLKNGEVLRESMDYAEIERVRAVSRSKDGPAWRNWWGEMAKKSVLRRCAKAAPNSAEIDALLARDDETPAMPSLVELPAMEPEPQRQIAGEPQPGVTYAVVDADGEEHEYATPQATGEALELIFADAAKRGSAALEAANENNAGTIRQLREAGHGAIAEHLLEHWQTLTTDLDPFGLPPLPTEQPPQEAAERPGASPPAGNGTRQGEPSPKPWPLDAEQEQNLVVPVPRKPSASDLDFCARQLMSLIGERPLDAPRAARIRLANEHVLGFLRLRSVEKYDEIQRALHAVVQPS